MLSLKWSHVTKQIPGAQTYIDRLVKLLNKTKLPFNGYYTKEEFWWSVFCEDDWVCQEV